MPQFSNRRWRASHLEWLSNPNLGNTKSEIVDCTHAKLWIHTVEGAWTYWYPQWRYNVRVGSQLLLCKHDRTEILIGVSRMPDGRLSQVVDDGRHGIGLARLFMHIVQYVKRSDTEVLFQRPFSIMTSKETLTTSMSYFRNNMTSQRYQD